MTSGRRRCVFAAPASFWWQGEESVEHGHALAEALQAQGE
jgi:hypothetical protein